MSRLLRLYPAAWRERYEAEFVGTLQERAIGLTGAVDIVHGAIDAHLHPELIGGAPHVWTHRLPGLLATAAGLIWAGFLVRILLARPEDEWGSSIFVAILFMVFAVLGEYMTSYARRIGLVVAAIVAATVLARVLPWSVSAGMLNVALGATASVLIGGGMLTLAALRAGIGAGVRWLLIAGALLVPGIVAIPIMGGFGPTDPGGVPAMVVASLPYGIAWSMIGLRMTIRGSETIHDTPTTEPTPEVAAA
jgi:hypothetical protein